MAATHRIPELRMVDLGKDLYQENRYSVLNCQMLRGIMENGPALEGALSIFDSIRDVGDVSSSQASSPF
jgi:hypothetical protein